MKNFLDKCISFNSSENSKYKEDINFDIQSMRFLRKRERNLRKLDLIKKYNFKVLKMLENKIIEDDRLLGFWIIWHFDTGKRKEFFNLSRSAVLMGLEKIEGFSRSLKDIRRSFALKYQKSLREKEDFSFSNDFTKILQESDSRFFTLDIPLFLKELFYIFLFKNDIVGLNAIYNIEISENLSQRIGIKTVFIKNKVKRIDFKEFKEKEKSLKAIFDI